jgi:hypothetical protein
MSDTELVSAKVRKRDYEAARHTTRELPLAIIDVFTAQRILWESATDKQRLDAIRRVRRKSQNAA